MLDVERDEVHGELSHALSLGVLKLKLQMRRVVLGRKCDAISGVSKLHDLCEESNVHAQHHACVSAVVLEALHAEVEGDKGDVGTVHSLQRNAYSQQLNEVRLERLKFCQ